MIDPKSPGVYIDEVSIFPPSVAQVETAIPAFIGYTEKAEDSDGQSLILKPTRIKAIADYREQFGEALVETFEATEAADGTISLNKKPSSPSAYMYYALEMYFANGGGPCYIVSVKAFGAGPLTVKDTELKAGLDALAKKDEPTLILFPDAVKITDETKYYTLYAQALAQCAKLKDRFTLIDVQKGTDPKVDTDVINGAKGLRDKIGTKDLKYGAAYYPFVKTILNYRYDTTKIDVKPTGADPKAKMNTFLGGKKDELYHKVKAAIEKEAIIMPPTSAIAGVYAYVDSSRGVWKAPANISLTAVKEPVVAIDEDINNGMNIDGSGKSVNAIRTFAGKGTLVWGARTLAGNDNEWRYISVRRFYNMVEESVKKATSHFVFEPNDANTWVKVRSMIENFLLLQWRNGALAGAKPEDAFFVKVGLGQTMTGQDILNGLMIVEIGMAAVRPAEFIILKFSHKMQES